MHRGLGEPHMHRINGAHEKKRQTFGLPQGIYFCRNKTPSVLGPQWEEMVQPARVM